MNLNLKSKNCELTISMDCESTQNLNVNPDNLKKIKPGNPANPFDEIGAFHNYAMKRIFMVNGEQEFNESVVVEKLDAMVKKYPFKSEVLNAIKGEDLREVYDKISYKLNKALKFNWLYPPTPEQDDCFPDFLDGIILWMGKTISSFDKSTDSLLEQKEEIMAYENKILKSDLKKELKETTLIALSMMRHSSILYIEHFNGIGGAGTVQGKNCQCKKVARIAVADFIGAASGFLAGNVVGAVVGGIVGSGKQFLEEV